ncbi:biotin carboxyl carrier protein of acetyl-CoA carboxylase 2, chloroplastic-like protein [Cinnamomum micranthum f. kanehirae]|uniref:Biotin carboxyl carrier protein of acetyl-CoA carboxylase 2, chloroplastic-like protein n=1 Tax=Cinnamomum micranthum f. kanehirae TaxID=337451 RepID=A0A3S3P551_9MAGN|nr:biotin carboxyl carrier protein of acetyl-CoA carboxylase 2, chloroplastic-like protein [Cinnamomum micranthum f. kanehirae]
MASISVPCPKCSAFASSGVRLQNLQQHSKVSFSPIAYRRHSLIGGSSLEQPRFTRFQMADFLESEAVLLRIELAVSLFHNCSRVAVEKSSNSTSATPTNSEAPSSDVKGVEPTKEPGVPDSSVSAFMSEVASLVKLLVIEGLTYSSQSNFQNVG